MTVVVAGHCDRLVIDRIRQRLQGVGLAGLEAPVLLDGLVGVAFTLAEVVVHQLAGGLFGTMRFVDRGTLDLPNTATW